MPALRRTDPWRRLHGKHVALDNRDLSEMAGDCLCGRKAGHAGANNHSMISCWIRHVFVLEGSTSNRIGNPTYPIFPGTIVKRVTNFGSGTVTKPPRSQAAPATR
jgi:hypothetical protein